MLKNGLVMDYDAFFKAWDTFIKKIRPYRRQRLPSTEDDYTDVKQLYIDNAVFENGLSIRQAFADYAKSFGVEYASVLLAPKNIKDQAEFPEYMSFCLLNTPLIDTSKAKWDQIIELRKDVESRNKLRNLRLFLYENYRGKDSDFIEDDLGRRIDEYERARKKHGFEMVISSIRALIDSKNLQAALGGGLAAALLGGPISGITTAALIELGSISIEIAKKRSDFKDLTEGHDLAFIIQAREKIK